MASTKQKFKAILVTKLEELFGFDLRSLAVFRIGLALIIITDLIVRAEDLRIYYLVHLISDQPLVQGLLLLFAGLVALALLFGYRTRLAAIACWALLLSLHNRNPTLIFATDDVLCALLFWAMFLPLGASYSVDSALNSSTKQLPKRLLSGATLALTVQICFVYMFSLFLFVPFRTTFFRCCTIVTFIILHAGFVLTLKLSILPLLSIFSWLVFIPSEIWDAVAKRLYTPQRAGLQIYYDGDCGFCKKVVHLIRTFLILPGTPLLLAQDDPAIFADMEAENSWVIVDWQGNRHFKFEALTYVYSLFPLFQPLTPVLKWGPVMWVGTKFYETVASNRSTAGKFTAFLKYRPVEVRSSLLINIVTLLLLVYWTLDNLNASPS